MWQKRGNAKVDFIEFSQSEILLLSNLIRRVRKETGLPLKMQSNNFLTRLNTAITACQDPKTQQLYQEFLKVFSQQDILQQLGIIKPRTNDEIKKSVYRGQVQTHSKSAPTKTEPESDVPAGKRKIIYRGQVKYVDK